MNNDTDPVAQWYREQFRTYGDDFKTLGFNHRSSQTKRFEVLRQLGRFDSRTLLDMGCGFGDFYAYLKNAGERPAYTGVDLTPEFVEQCRARYEGEQAQFEHGDVLSYQPKAPFDYVVASGIFGLKTENGAALIAESITRLFSWCTVGLAVNFLSMRAVRRAERSLYVDPSAIVKIALKLTPAIRLSHDYLPNDFTVFLYRIPSWEAGK